MSSKFTLKPSFAKTLSAVEADATRSNQHEFNGVQGLKRIFGVSSFSRDAIFSIDGTSISCHAGVTWYDAREAHQTRTEHRLYFKSNTVMNQAVQGDDIVIGFDQSNQLHCVLIKTENEKHSGNIVHWSELPD